MSDTPSAELHTEPAHGRVGITGEGAGRVGVQNEELRCEMEGVGVGCVS